MNDNLIIVNAKYGVLLAIAAVIMAGCASQPEPLTFVVVADVQYADEPAAGGRFYRDSLVALERFVEQASAMKPAFAVQLGDFINGGSEAQASLNRVARIYGQLECPRYHVLGNHDFQGLTRMQTMAILGMQHPYYAVDVKGWRLVILDTQDVAVQGGWAPEDEHCQAAQGILEQLRKAGRANAQDYNGGFSDQQLEWLDKSLTEADAAGLPVITMGHLPLLPAGEKHTAWNAERAVAVLERHRCVKAYLCGHIHLAQTSRQNGIYYASLEAVVDTAAEGGVWYTVQLEPQRLVIETHDGHGNIKPLLDGLIH